MDKIIVQSIFEELGLNNVWLSQTVPCISWLKTAIKLRLSDQYKQHWANQVSISKKGTTYRIFKINFNLENYLLNLFPHYRNTMTKFRTSNHKLPIETGRWTDIARSDRKCMLCDLNEIGDEFHYLFKCNYLKKERNHLINSYYYVRPNVMKFEQLFNLDTETKQINLCKFLNIIMDKFK